MINQRTVPKWNLKQQRQEQVEGGGSRETNNSNRSFHVHTHHHHQQQNHLVPIPVSSDYEIAELTWENGQIAMHGLGGLLRSSQTKPTWGGAGRTNETLESIVHQATTPQKHHHQQQQQEEDGQTPAKTAPSTVASSNGKWAETSSMGLRAEETGGPMLMKKRTRSESNYQCGSSRGGDYEQVERSACASGSAAFCRESDTTMMTFASFDSPPPSFKPKTTTDHEDSASHGGGSENQDEDQETKTETVRSHSSRRSRAAAIHNQSERRRRDRINQKMKALQKLVPNASKTDKASMLDEVIEYLKQLQAQVQVMSSVSRSMPHHMNMNMNMMMPMGMQQHHHHHLHQMSLLARMGMAGLGMGMGMLDINSLPHSSPHQLLHPAPPPVSAAASTASTFVPPPPPAFVIPDQPAPAHGPIPLPDPYCNFLAQQSMNLDLYNKMAALYRQQVNQTTQATSNPSQQSNMQGD